MGIGLDGVISGDSLFGRQPGAAAIAVADMSARLVASGGALIDAQWDGPLLRSLGAAPMPRERYLRCSTARRSRSRSRPAACRPSACSRRPAA